MSMLPWPIVTGTAGVAAIAALSYGAFWPRSRWFAPVIWRGDRDGRPRVALTFDDGPHPDATPAILDVLAAHGAPAAFFVIGEHARRHPHLLRRLDAEGHLIGNHTDTHAYHGMWRGVSYWQRELRRTGDHVEQAIGKRPRLFRPPMGFKQGLMATAMRREGCVMVNWTRRGRDGWPTTADKIRRRLAMPARAGDILVLHDGDDLHLRRDPRPTIEAVGPLIEALHERGLELVRLDELIGEPGYQ